VWCPVTANAQGSKPNASISASLSGEARTAYRLGVVLFDDGDWSGARDQFARAHLLSKNPRLLWNLAVCEKNLRRYTKALAFVDAYLTDPNVRIPNRERVDISSFRDTVEKLTRWITISLDELQALIYLDGELVEAKEIQRGTRVDVGDREIVVHKAGFIEFKSIVSSATVLPLRIVLVRDEGTLIVKAKPEQAEISINGKLTGRGKFEGKQPSGPISLKVIAPGMRVYKDEILITRGSTRTVDVTLETSSSRRLWAWVGAGAILLGAAAITTYFVSNPTIERPPIQEGSWATVRLRN
jgi:PEGA domain